MSITAVFLALILSACSSEQLYASVRNAQRAECMKRADAGSRDQCLKDADIPLDTYKKEVGAPRK
jgi:hypothetical protein